MFLASQYQWDYVDILEGSAPIGGLLLALVEGWCPMATWEGLLRHLVLGDFGFWATFDCGSILVEGGIQNFLWRILAAGSIRWPYVQPARSMAGSRRHCPGMGMVGGGGVIINLCCIASVHFVVSSFALVDF